MALSNEQVLCQRADEAEMQKKKITRNLNGLAINSNLN